MTTHRLSTTDDEVTKARQQIAAVLGEQLATMDTDKLTATLKTGNKYETNFPHMFLKRIGEKAGYSVQTARRTVTKAPRTVFNEYSTHATDAHYDKYATHIRDVLLDHTTRQTDTEFSTQQSHADSTTKREHQDNREQEDNTPRADNSLTVSNIGTTDTPQDTNNPTGTTHPNTASDTTLTNGAHDHQPEPTVKEDHQQSHSHADKEDAATVLVTLIELTGVANDNQV